MKVVLLFVALVVTCVASSSTLGLRKVGAQTDHPQTQSRADVPVADLIARLKDKNAQVAKESAEALAARGAEAVPALEQVLKSEKKTTVLMLAALTLGRIRPEHPEVVAALVRVAKGRGLFDSEETLMARLAAGMFLGHSAAGIRALP